MKSITRSLLSGFTVTLAMTAVLTACGGEKAPSPGAPKPPATGASAGTDTRVYKANHRGAAYTFTYNMGDKSCGAATPVGVYTWKYRARSSQLPVCQGSDGRHYMITDRGKKEYVRVQDPDSAIIFHFTDGATTHFDKA